MTILLNYILGQIAPSLISQCTDYYVGQLPNTICTSVMIAAKLFPIKMYLFVQNIYKTLVESNSAPLELIFNIF